MQGNKYMISFQKVTKWTNLKAVIYGACQGGTCYHYLRTFTVRKLIQNFGIYILHGLDTPKRVKMKLKPQRINNVNRNDSVFNNLGPNS